MKTPIAFIIFDRPSTTIQVFEAIRKARPPLLLVVADGPRQDVPVDVDHCEETRSIISRVDWACEVRTNYSDANLGCQKRVSTGLDWVFGQVEEAIILEDDCLPDPTFFPFCEELLQRYRYDERISQISGINFQFGRTRTDYSYYFSRYNHIWGWASWRRAWKGYDVSMKLWPQIRDGKWLRDLLGERRLVAYWTRVFNRVHEERINTWDYQWLFHSWLSGRLSILPNVNLVSNIGFHVRPTHKSGADKYANMETRPMEFPLRHPPYLIRDAGADKYTDTHHLMLKPFPISVLRGLKARLENRTDSGQ